MTAIKVSEKGQVTLPADMRRKYDISPGAMLEVEPRKEGLLLRRMKTVDEMYGMFADYAKPGTTHEQEHEVMERAVAEEAVRE